jgi:ABC-2 type transporter
MFLNQATAFACMFHQFHKALVLYVNFHREKAERNVIFFQPDRGTQQDILNAMGSMYAAVLFIGITNATSVQPVISIERFVSYRERAAGMYSALPFAFSLV